MHTLALIGGPLDGETFTVSSDNPASAYLFPVTPTIGVGDVMNKDFLRGPEPVRQVRYERVTPTRYEYRPGGVGP